jgi:hypothetical protein
MGQPYLSIDLNKSHAEPMMIHTTENSGRRVSADAVSSVSASGGAGDLYRGWLGAEDDVTLVTLQRLRAKLGPEQESDEGVMSFPGVSLRTIACNFRHLKLL